jgi:hypothetical protein
MLYGTVLTQKDGSHHQSQEQTAPNQNDISSCTMIKHHKQSSCAFEKRSQNDIK